jgi:hypothetical protein
VLARLLSRIRFGILPPLAIKAGSIRTGNPSQSTAGSSRGPPVRGIRLPAEYGFGGQDARSYEAFV